MQIIRSRRKTIALIITPDGELLVRAPLRASLAQIEAFVQAKAGWIDRHQERARQAAASRAPAPRFLPGERFAYLGERYPLELVARARPALALEDGRFRLAESAQPRAAQAFAAWYRQQAKAVILPRAQALAAQFGFQPAVLRVSAARTRWGSCSNRGTLTFSWRLALAPPAVIDYVILHELCHLQERNHGPRFWALVERLCPDYRALREQLKLVRVDSIG